MKIEYWSDFYMEYLNNFDKILELHSNFKRKNMLIVSFFKRILEGDNHTDSGYYQSLYDHYTDDMNNLNDKLAETTDYSKIVSLLVDRERYLDYLLKKYDLSS